MTKPMRPENNLLIYRPFSAEGFHKLNVFPALLETGYSNAEIRRLFKAGAIKINDTKLTEDKAHFVWYERPVREVELIEKGDYLLIGKHRVLEIKPTYVNPFKRFWWYIRPYVESDYQAKKAMRKWWRYLIEKISKPVR